MMMANLKYVSVLLLVVLLLGVVFVYLNPFYRLKEGFCDSSKGRFVGELLRSPDLHLVAPDGLEYPQPSITHGRTDIVSLTPWLAPVVWEGTFNPVLLDSIYQQKNISIAATVFAVGKYIMFLKDFLETAEKHFFVGFRVQVYVFTDRPKEVPEVKMAAGREEGNIEVVHRYKHLGVFFEDYLTFKPHIDDQLIVRSVPSSKRWQEISARRMELVQMLIEEALVNNVDYIFCLDVDSKFHNRWGTESLGALVAVIHPGYYQDSRDKFPYERRSSSRAYLAPGEGDFYYCGGAFGGLLTEVHQLAQTCRKNFEDDAKEHIEAAWQEESHLNKYMWTNKPSKVLSPEYLWQDFKPRNPEIHTVRFSGVIKNYAEIRPN